jgi:hypothetical protein
MLAAMTLVEADDAFVRNEAVRLLGTFGEAAMPALSIAIASEDADVRKFVLDAMSTINTNLKEDIYRKVLSDSDINLVITAVEHIGRDNMMSLRESVETVMEQAAHPMLISACVKSLARIGNSGSLNAMYRKLGSDGMPEFQIPGFIRAIGNLGIDIHVELLCRFIEWFPSMLLDAGFDAIEAMRRRVSLPQAPSALRAVVLAAVAENSDPIGQYKAVRALGAFADDLSTESIRNYLQYPDKMVRLAAVECIGRADPLRAQDLLATRQSVETDEDVLAAIEEAANHFTRTAA